MIFGHDELTWRLLRLNTKVFSCDKRVGDGGCAPTPPLIKVKEKLT